MHGDRRLKIVVPERRGFKPEKGYVPDAKTAIAIAVAAWIPIYGKKHIDGEKPYNAELKDGIWRVTGTLEKPKLGAWRRRRYRRKTARILKIVHGK